MTQPMDFRTRTRSVREAARRQLQKLREERIGQRVPRLAESPPSDAVMPEAVMPAPDLAEDLAPEAPPELEAPAEVAQTAPAEEAIAPPALEEVPPPKRKAAPRKPAAKPAAKSAAKPAKTARGPVATRDNPEDRSISRAALAEMFEEDAPQAEAPRRLRPVPASTPPRLAPEPVAPAAVDHDSIEEVDGPEDQGPVPDLAPELAEAPPPDSAAVAEPAPTAAQELSRDLAGLPGAGPGLIWMLGQCGITTLAQLAACDPRQLSTDLGLVGQILDVSLWRDYALREIEGLSQAS